MDLIFKRLPNEESESIRERYIIRNRLKNLEYLPNIGSINLLLGANNSGKSQFIRFLCNYINGFEIYNYKQVSEFTSKINEFKTNIDNTIKDLQKLGFNDLSNPRDILINTLGAIKTNLNNKDLYKNKNAFLTLLEEYKQLGEKLNYYLANKGILSSIESTTYILKDLIKSIINDYQELSNNSILYIPALRTAHSLYSIEDRIEENIYKYTYQKNYEIDSKIDVFTGLDLYNQILNKRNSHSDDRRDIEAFEKFLSDNFFKGEKIDVIAKFNYDKSLKNDDSERNISIKIGNEDDRFLYELGDGIQSLIILLFKILTAEENSIIFIDEPELYLHPGMQRIFLDQIIRSKELKKKNITYFISTHSNHFLDLTLYENKISIYTFIPKIIEGNKKFEIRNVNQGDNSILRELGVNNSSVFIANCSIWVEGISDRMIIKAMLYAYIEYKYPNETFKHPKEDIDFSFFEYAGSNIEHYVFDNDLSKDREQNIERQISALSLSNKILLVADYDNATGAKKARIHKLKAIDKTGFSTLISEDFREIENMLSKSIWKKVLIEFCSKKEINENNKSNIQKNISEKIDSIKNFESYRLKYIGEFLQKIKSSEIPLNEVCKKKGAKWQTFDDKAKLAEIIHNKTISKEIVWEDFVFENDLIEGYIETIYNFIKD